MLRVGSRTSDNLDFPHRTAATAEISCSHAGPSRRGDPRPGRRRSTERLGSGEPAFHAGCDRLRRWARHAACGAYGTLPGHSECGEEGFLLRMVDTGAVSASVTIDAVPETWLTHLGGPVARPVQDVAVRRYLAGMAGG